MALVYELRENDVWPSGWYRGTISSVEETEGKFGPQVKLVIDLVNGAEERSQWAFCTLPTSRRHKGYLWYTQITGEIPEDSLRMDNLLGLDTEVRLEVTIRESDGAEINSVVAFRRPRRASAEANDNLFAVNADGGE